MHGNLMANVHGCETTVTSRMWHRLANLNILADNLSQNLQSSALAFVSVAMAGRLVDMPPVTVISGSGSVAGPLNVQGRSKFSRDGTIPAVAASRAEELWVHRLFLASL